jgi:hypothetical protein
MKKLNDILESIVLTIQDEEVQYPEEYALSELRKYIKDEELIKALYEDIKEML